MKAMLAADRRDIAGMCYESWHGLAAPPTGSALCYSSGEAGYWPQDAGGLAEDAATYLMPPAALASDVMKIDTKYLTALGQEDVLPPALDFLESYLYIATGLVDESRAVARRALDRFQSLGAVLAASLGDLLRVDGMTSQMALALKAIHKGMRCVLKEPLQERINISSFDAVIDYLGAAMRFEMVEVLRVLFLDRKNGLIRDEVMHTGTVDHVPLYPREIVRRALETGASALIIAHNHPSGDPTPSKQDISMTRDIMEALRVFHIAMHEHFVIGKHGTIGLRQAGYV